MTFETFLALLTLALIAAWTPGPNNLMLASSGANFGLRRTLPHICGVAFGFPIMIFVVATGLGAIIAASAALQDVMRWAGAALLLWFAWRIATSGRAQDQSRARPLNFLEAAGFQWVNPKAWAMAMATTAQFVTGSAVIVESLLCSLAYAMAGLGSSIVWAGFGVWIRRLLSTDLRLRIFNISMGLLIASFVFVLFRDEF
jgi:threonine/homoserine/homoserine lactone efflux protein